MVKRTGSAKYYAIESAHSYGILADAREIFIHGAHEQHEDPGVDYRMATAFLKNMRFLETESDSKPIVIHQHSIGGEWADGMLMYDAIASSSCPILFITHGIAASMGSIVPQAAVKHGNAYRVATDQCQWLIHDGYTDINGGLTYKQSKSWSKMETKTRKIMTDIYVDACKTGSANSNKTDAQIRRHILSQLDRKEDWWLTAREATEFGFVDAVLGDEGYGSIQHILDNWSS